jgi:hypothetical protein
VNVQALKRRRGKSPGGNQANGRNDNDNGDRRWAIARKREGELLERNENFDYSCSRRKVSKRFADDSSRRVDLDAIYDNR